MKEHYKIPLIIFSIVCLIITLGFTYLNIPKWTVGDKIIYCSDGNPLLGEEMKDGIILYQEGKNIVVRGKRHIIDSPGEKLFEFASGYGERIYLKEYCIRHKLKRKDIIKVRELGANRGRTEVNKH